METLKALCQPEDTRDVPALAAESAVTNLVDTPIVPFLRDLPGRNRVLRLAYIDARAAGDVSRIIVDGMPPIPGETPLDRARFLEREFDGLRQRLLSEPYGDPSMSVNMMVPTRDPQAEAGLVIMEAMGYPTFSGSNVICTATALLESGHLPMTEGERRVRLDCPAGSISLTAKCRADRVEAVTYDAVPSYVAARGHHVELPEFGAVAFDLVWGGVFYAVVDAAAFGLHLTRDDAAALAALGASIVEALQPTLRLRHPVFGDLGALAFVCLAGSLENVGPEFWQSRTASYVHPGVICNGPTGTGTAARLALHAEKGELRRGDTLETISPFGNRFQGTLLEDRPVGHERGFGTAITGKAEIIGRGEISIDLRTPVR